MAVGSQVEAERQLLEGRLRDWTRQLEAGQIRFDQSEDQARANSDSCGFPARNGHTIGIPSTCARVRSALVQQILVRARNVVMRVLRSPEARSSTE